MRAPLSSWISAAITHAPSLTNRSTVPRPMPLAAPVITATLPSRRPAMILPPNIVLIDHNPAPGLNRKTMSIPDPVALAQALIRRPSVTPDDAGVLGVLEAVLKPLGFACHRLRFEAPGTAPIDNLYARIGTAEPNFCFAGQTDVVPPGEKWRHD